VANPSYTYTLSNGTTADASQVMQDFNDILNGVTDGTKDLSISALTVAGTATLNGNVTLGNATGDDITYTGSLASSIPIKTTNTYNIGSSTLGLASVYLGANSQTVRLLPSASMSATWTFTLPVTAGTADYFLTTNGSGVGAWTAITNSAWFATASAAGTVSTAAQSFGGLKKFEGGLIEVANIDTTDSNIALANASSRRRAFTGFTAARTVTLPTTSILAGEVFTLENKTTFAMTVNASGGAAIDIIATGTITLRATQDTPTTAAHWVVLDLHEYVPDGTTVSHVSSSAISVSLLCTRRSVGTNRLVTISIADEPSDASKTNTTAPLATSSVAARFRPGANGHYAPTLIRNNNADEVGYFQLPSTGILTWQRGSSAAWTSGAACRLFSGSITFIT